jgi:hypothetical protein
MKAAISVAFCLLSICALGMSAVIPAQEEEFKEKQPKKEHFYALAYMPSGGGPRMVGAGATANVDIRLNSYTSDAEAKHMAGALFEGGPDALLNFSKGPNQEARLLLLVAWDSTI